jgi:glycosyltransferase involved in cell wall biosynthesis
MRVAVDARELVRRPTGVGRYLHSLLERWAQMPRAARHEWILYAPQAIAVPNGMRVEVLAGRGGTVWEQGTLPRALARGAPDVLFAPGYTSPFAAPCPVVLTVHDVSFAAHPEWFSPREGLRRRQLTAWSARRARLVLTDSAFSRDEIVRLLGIPPARLRIVPLGASHLEQDGRVDSSGAAAGHVRFGENSPGRSPLVLFVGSIFRRRRIDLLIEAFVHHVAPRVPDSRLEIVGDNRMYPPGDPAALLRAAPPGVASRVALRSYVDDRTLMALYQQAMVFAFLSEYEGFGLTPLEALARGVPPLVLDTPVAREVYGEAAVYVSPQAPAAAVGEAIVDLLTSPARRNAVLARAPEVVARYDWSRTAEATLDALEEAAGV